MFIIWGRKWPELSLIDVLVCTDQSNGPIAFQGEVGTLCHVLLPIERYIVINKDGFN